MKDDLLDDLLGEETDQSYEEEDKILTPLLDEIDLIEDPGIMTFIRAVLVRAPAAFWVAPSSFTGNYHPPDERREGGGILHTKRVCRIAREMTVAQDRSQEELDQITAAALIHDITKGTMSESGDIAYDPMHPYTVDAFVAWVRAEDDQRSDESRSSTLWISDDDLATILRLVRCHMGSWSPIPETAPVTSLELTLHLADLLATKLHFMLDGEDVREYRWMEPTNE